MKTYNSFRISHLLAAGIPSADFDRLVDAKAAEPEVQREKIVRPVHDTCAALQKAQALLGSMGRTEDQKVVLEVLKKLNNKLSLENQGLAALKAASVKKGYAAQLAAVQKAVVATSEEATEAANSLLDAAAQ